MKIYTKTGDQGQTRLVDGQSLSKAHPRLNAYGSLDELNSFLGLALTKTDSVQELAPHFRQIQNYLFNVGSHLACEQEETRAYLPALDSKQISHLETQIDAMTAALPPLKEFIIPGGSELAAHLHVCRTVCRRTERQVVELMDTEGVKTYLSECLIYLNRLSDYFFVAARFANHQLHFAEPKWVKE